MCHNLPKTLVYSLCWTLSADFVLVHWRETWMWFPNHAEALVIMACYMKERHLEPHISHIIGFDSPSTILEKWTKHLSCENKKRKCKTACEDKKNSRIWADLLLCQVCEEAVSSAKWSVSCPTSHTFPLGYVFVYLFLEDVKTII
jgi:ribosomal protein L37AE/L43A